MKCVEGMSMIILVVMLGCRKNDRLEPVQSESPTKLFSQQQIGVKESEWLPQAEWNFTEQPAYSMFHSDIKTDAVTDDIVDNGLVRVFKISGADKNSPGVALPVEEIKDGQKVYWYYEVTAGNILISADVYGNKVNPADGSLFKYIILSKNNINNLEEKGFHQTDLMDLPYEKMKEISR